MILPAYKSFGKNNIPLDSFLHPCIPLDNPDVNPDDRELLAVVSEILAEHGFDKNKVRFDIKTGSIVLTEYKGIADWNVQRVKKFHTLTLAIYQYFECDYLEL
jgi:hypothetical protein